MCEISHQYCRRLIAKWQKKLGGDYFYFAAHHNITMLREYKWVCECKYAFLYFTYKGSTTGEFYECYVYEHSYYVSDYNDIDQARRIHIIEVDGFCGGSRQ